MRVLFVDGKMPSCIAMGAMIRAISRSDVMTNKSERSLYSAIMRPMLRRMIW